MTIKRTIENDDNTDTVLVMLLDIGYNEWEKLIDSLNDGGIDLARMSDIASSISVYAAEISEYLGERGGNGYGDHGHDDAMKDVAKTRKRIRKALGYSYP